jgi:hypothetical protein
MQWWSRCRKPEATVVRVLARNGGALRLIRRGTPFRNA